jgi:hypothetical protein
MDKSQKEYLFYTYNQEYEKHRDEIQNRINLQNGTAQRGWNITVLAGTLLVAMFAYYQKDCGNDFCFNVGLFCPVIPLVLFFHGVLILLTIANWIYQLSMIQMINRYWNWTVVNKIEPKIGIYGNAYLWSRLPKPPWSPDRLHDQVIRYFQPLFLYAQCIPSLIGLLIIANLEHCKDKDLLPDIISLEVSNFSWVAFTGLAIAFFIVIFFHKKLELGFKEDKKNLWEVSKVLKIAQHCLKKINFFHECAGGPMGHSQALHFYTKLGQLYNNSGKTKYAPILRQMYLDAGKLMEEMKLKEDEHKPKQTE